MLKEMQAVFGSEMVYTCARKARINEHDKVCIEDVVIFDHAGQSKVGFVKMHVGVHQHKGGTVEAMTLINVLDLRSTRRGISNYTDSAMHLFVPTASVMKACIWAKSNGTTNMI